MFSLLSSHQELSATARWWKRVPLWVKWNGIWANTHTFLTIPLHNLWLLYFIRNLSISLVSGHKRFNHRIWGPLCILWKKECLLKTSPWRLFSSHREMVQFFEKNWNARWKWHTQIVRQHNWRLKAQNALRSSIWDWYETWLLQGENCSAVMGDGYKCESWFLKLLSNTITVNKTIFNFTANGFLEMFCSYIFSQIWESP